MIFALQEFETTLYGIWHSESQSFSDLIGESRYFKGSGLSGIDDKMQADSLSITLEFKS